MQQSVEQGLPDRYIRHETAYRTEGKGSGPGDACAVPGCGFMLKPTKRGEHIDHVTSDYVAVYVLRGRGSYVDWNGRTHPLYPGCVAQRIPGRRHSTLLAPDGLWAEVFVVIGRRFFEALASARCVDPERPVLKPGLHIPLVEQFDAILSELSKGSGLVPPRVLLKAHELITDIYALDEASRDLDPDAKLVEAAREILSADLSGRASLHALAANFSLSYERFRKIFRERSGVSPGAYRLRRRIEAACRLLTTERLSVKEVAFSLGYPDIHSFSKQFKQFTGVSPTRFRGDA